MSGNLQNYSDYTWKLDAIRLIHLDLEVFFESCGRDDSNYGASMSVYVLIVFICTSRVAVNTKCTYAKAMKNWLLAPYNWFQSFWSSMSNHYRSSSYAARGRFVWTAQRKHLCHLFL